MRILFTRFPLESAYGGAEIQTLSLMQGLIEHGHEVSFLGSCPVLLKLCREAGIPAISLEIGPPPVSKWYVISFLWRKWAMKKELVDVFSRNPSPPSDPIVRAGKSQVPSPELVCMLSLSEKLLMTDWLTQQNIRVFWIEHDPVGRWLRQNPWLPKLRRLSTMAKTIVVSALSADVYEKLGWQKKDLVVIPNGVDYAKFVGVHPPEESKALRIGCVARLQSEKGVDLLIQAVSALPQFALTIIGSGSEEPVLRTMIQDLNLKERVEILPSGRALREFYASIDLFVLPSRSHDPFGLVAAEAIGLGIPTIVTDQCGISGYLKNTDDALIVPAGSSDALQNALKRLEDPGLRAHLSEHGTATARNLFSLERMVTDYEKVFKNSSDQMLQPL